MATTDLVQLLTSQINELDSTIDTSVGSNVRDLLINPISTLLEGYQTEHDQIINNLSLADPTGLTEQELDAIGKNFLVERRAGTYHTGTIKIYFSAAIPFSIPANTRFLHQASGFEYETVDPYTITRVAMLNNFDVNGFYSTAEIAVRSVERTAAGTLNQGTVLTTESLTSPQPARIEVVEDITGGSLRENNQSFYNRIKTSVLTTTLASKDIIEQQVKAESNAIKFVDVIGAGSAFMKRDKVAYNELTGATIENFQYVQSGLASDAKFKQHQAFINNFKIEVVVSGQAASLLKNADEQLNESTFSDTGDQLYIVDTSGAQVKAYDLTTDYDPTTATNLTTFDLSAQLSSPERIAFKADGTEMYITAGSKAAIFVYDLGTAWDITTATYDRVVSAPTDIKWPDTPSEWTTEFSNEQYRGLFELEDALTSTQDQYQIVSIPAWSDAILSNWLKNDGARASNSLRKPEEIRLDGGDIILGETPDTSSTNDSGITVPEAEVFERDLIIARDSNDTSLINDIIDRVAEAQKPENYSNMAPILHKNILQHTGIDIDVTMSTTDSTEDGEMCYITVLRNDEIYIPFDGYGLAWRKQPGFLLRLDADSYGGDTEQRNTDIAKFEDFFGDNPVTVGVIGDISNPANDQYWLYNMYMVDNNALDEEIVIGTTKVFDGTNGINQYLQRAKYWIEDNTDYDFRVEITNNLGTVIKVKPTANGSFDEVMNKGATYPAYVPNAGEKINTGNSSVDALDSTRGHFGIGVLSTKGYEWTIKDTFIRSNTQTFPMHLFRFKIDYTKWAGATDNFDVDYWGVGYDPDQYSADGNTGNSRTQAAIWNSTTNAWEFIGTHTATIADSSTNKKLTKEFTDLSVYADTNDYIYVAASAANFGENYEDNTDHNLITYYVQLSNPDAGTVSLGNAIDVYCHVPTQIKEGSSVYTANGDGVIEVTDGYITDISEVREAVSNVAIPVADYDIYNMNPGESFGPDNKLRVTLDPSYGGAQIRVIYRYWSGASPINAYLNAPENRYPAVTIKEKAAPTTIITINELDYSGDLDVNLARSAVVDYINDIEDGVLEKSDIVKVLSDLGATFVSLDMDINIKQYNTLFNFNRSSFTTDRYTIPSNTIGYFYTNTTLVGGITKI